MDEKLCFRGVEREQNQFQNENDQNSLKNIATTSQGYCRWVIISVLQRIVQVEVATGQETSKKQGWECYFFRKVEDVSPRIHVGYLKDKEFLSFFLPFFLCFPFSFSFYDLLDLYTWQYVSPHTTCNLIA